VLPAIPEVGVNESKLCNAETCRRRQGGGRILLTNDLQQNIRYPSKSHHCQVWLYLFSLQLKRCQRGTAPTFLRFQELESHFSLGFVQSQKEDSAPKRQLYPLLGMREEKGPQFSESETLQWALSEFL
jgi:hypothetical protein